MGLQRYFKMKWSRNVKVTSVKGVNLKCKNLTNVHKDEYKNLERMLKIKLFLSETLGNKFM